MSKPTFRVRLLVCAVIIQTIAIPFSDIRIAQAADANTQTPPSIVIGEVMWAGSSLSTADEWVELWNTSTTDISIGNWSLRGASEQPIIFLATTTIPAKGVYLISNYPSSEAKSIAATTSQMITTAIALSNSQLRLELVDAAGSVVDMAGTGGVPPAGASGSAFKTSMIRSIASDGTIGWASAVEPRNLKSTVPDLATPGWYDDFIKTTTEQPANTTVDTPSASSTSIITNIDTSSQDVEIDTSVATIAEESMMMPNVAPAVPARPPDLPPRPNYHLIRLNEIAPAPAKGKEWVELVSLDVEKTIPLVGYELHDGQGRILKIQKGQITPGQHYVIRLSRAVLANAGDSVSLHAPDGSPIDTLHYGKTAKGSVWVRFPDTSGEWQGSTSSTPGTANVSAQEQATSTSSEETLDESATTSTLTAPEITDTNDSDDDQTEAGIESDVVASENTVEALKPTKAPKKSSTKTTSKAKEPILAFTFDMLSSIDTDQVVRVRLHGVVGTPPKLIKNRSFILQAPDGRGLLVVATTDRKLPAMGQSVTLSGRLTAGADGALLKLHADDTWQAEATSGTIPLPRAMDLFAPTGEDIWSLVQATGTVQEIKGRTIHIEDNGLEADVIISSRVAYRPQRLKKGDVIHIMGLLGPSDDAPIIYPRSADDIVLVTHAPIAQAVTTLTAENTQERLPFGAWTPIGATAGAIGAAEGGKRLYRRRKQRKLEQKSKTQEVKF